MTEIPQWVLPHERRRVAYARELAAKAGPETEYAVEQLVSTLVQVWEWGHRQADEHRAKRDRLEKLVVRLGGGFDRRGLEGDPPGFIVQHGIHTVIEDAP